jgi:hypothetical protein
MFPPSAAEPVDALELVLYYRDANEPVDIAHRTVEAAGQSSTQLQDFTVSVPTVWAEDAWAGRTIGIAIRAAGQPGGFWDLDHVRLLELQPLSLPIANASFEAPPVDPEGFGALPFVEGWTEVDLDLMGSTNTGVFANTDVNSLDHIVNADGNQLAFLGSEQGNALEQDLAALFRVGCEYRLTMGVGVSGRFPPSGSEPADTLELVLFYRDANEPVDVARQVAEATGQSSTQLQDVSVSLPAVAPGDAWAERNIGIAIRAAGLAGGFWDLDHARLVEIMPVSVPIVNASFEAPPVDPNGFGALPFVEGWTEIDLDPVGSTNTGVFINTAVDSPDHVTNADGSQLAFLGSEQGNALEQDLETVFEVGRAYRLSVAVGVSGMFPPSSVEPIDMLELALYYRDNGAPVEIVCQVIEATGQSSTHLNGFSAYIPPVQPDDAWAGQAIGIAVRAVGSPGGFWDLDHVRLAASLPLAEGDPGSGE